MCSTYARLAAALIALGLTATAAADTLDEIQKRGELIFGGDAEGGGPFVFPREDDPTQVQGFEIELASLLAAKLGVKARFSQGQWEKLPDLLERGDIDIVLNGYEWTPTWSQRYAASIPYYVYELQMLVRKNDDRLKQLKDLSMPGLDGKMRIAVLGGSAAETYVRKTFGSDVEVVTYEGTTDAMRGVELAIDGVDATMQDLPIATYYESRFPLLRRLGEPVEPGFYVALARKSDQRLVAALNRAIVDCYLDGSFPRVLARYGLWNETQRRRGLVTDSQGNFQPDPPADGAAAVPPLTAGAGNHIFTRRVPLLIQAAVITVLLASLAMPLAILVGLSIAVGRLYGPKFLRPPLGWYVEIVRGTPLVLQLYLIFFLLPEWGLSIPAFWAAIIGLAVNYSAYEAEIYRAGLQAIPRGQMEAALSLGMPKWLALRRIIIPQAFRIVIPPVMNDFIAMFKDTAVCSVITVVELSKEYYIHARSTGAVVELGLVTALLYLVMSYPLSIFVGRMERRLGEGRHHD
ncbi:MAG TPA: ABC transporter substrate-binding protein/permease [Pirellulaceae bacterium]|nr:ABC transporter substrate-binding protein/permease [Pirellulaceae bacterium]